jgi:zinc protease
MVPSLALALLFSASDVTPPAPVAAIPFDTYTLENGLHVILSEDHSVPFVQVNIWYGVGSKDEVKGRTGFAHLFEHLMFQGSAHQDGEYFAPLMPIGARVNGTTNTDRTNFFEGVPSDHLPLALWLESDRMGWLLPALTDEKIQNQKDVVRNERRQRYDNAPYGQVPMWLDEALYPDGHPYHVPTIGLHEDIEAATPEDVKAFFQKWYTPNNAYLAIVGDFDPAQARELVDRYFGDVPRGPDAHPILEATASLSEEKVVRQPSKVPLDRVWIAWLTPPIYANGDAALDVASAILADGKDSPLYKRLVHDKKVATDISAYQSSARLQSNFVIEGTAAPGHTTDEVVAEVDKVLAEFLKGPPTAEAVTVARTRIERNFFEGLQSIQAKANQLNGYAYVTGDPGYIGKDLARYRELTPAAVEAAAKSWIGGKNRVVLHVFPEAKAGGAK